MDHPDAQRPDRLDRLGLIAGPLAVLILFVWLAGWTGPARPHAGASAIIVLLSSTPWALAWLVAAFGLGWPLQRLLDRRGDDPFVVQLGLGIAAMLIIDAALGALGALQWGGSLGAWTLLLTGIALAIVQRRYPAPAVNRTPSSVPWLLWMAAPALAVLLLAACSAPGWLWASEFGGYDALSYHLQLPKEWMALGRIEPLTHNVYSYLPGYVEAAYYHLAVLIGDPIQAVYACQLLHAAMAVLTAVIVARLAGRIVGRSVARPVGAAAAVLLIGTPWVVVVGSLGYNEMAVTLLLAIALSILLAQSPTTWQHGVILGLLTAAACGAKLTAAGFVVLPLMIVALFTIARRRWLGVILPAGVAGLFGLLPYLLRNWIYSDNPVFPFMTEIFGSAHWSQDQVGNWIAGHVSEAALGPRLIELWNQLWRFGLGPNPSPPEPWSPQWSLLPWLAAAGLMFCLTIPSVRRVTLKLTVILTAQILFWLALTHLKSRFLLVGVVGATLSVAVALGLILPALQSRIGARGARALLAALLLAWSGVPVIIYAAERGGAPAASIGQASLMTGENLSEPQRIELAHNASPAVYLNHLLPDGARTLLVGEARPLYYQADIAYQTTWDRGPLSQIMRAFPSQPNHWADELRGQGFTHLLVSDEMLQRWAASKWNDPNLTVQKVRAFAAQYCDVEYDWRDVEHDQPNLHITLYRLRESPLIRQRKDAVKASGPAPR
ncbi:MAG: hypothetical protein V3T84_08890 [Phycisphaerales bacterium]